VTIEARLADGTILRFPDGTDPAVIQAAVRKQMGIAQEAAQQAAGPPVITGGAVVPLRSGEETTIGGTTDAPQKTLFQSIDQTLMKVPGVAQLAEIAAASNRSTAGLLDFIGPTNINEVLQLMGVESRVPTFSSFTTPKGAFVGEGFQADVLSGVGEVMTAGGIMGTGMRAAVGTLPKLTQASESAIRGIFRQLGTTTPRQDLVFGAAGGGGAEIGAATGVPGGEQIGMFAGPGIVAGGRAGLNRFFSSGEDVRNLVTSLSSLSEEGAAGLLAEAMVREGVSAEDIAIVLQSLGPEAIPADVGMTFARLLRVASNQIPRIQGRAAQVFSARQEGQAARLVTALDSAAGVPGLNVDDEIQRLALTFGPEIAAAYAAARARGLPLSPTIQTLLAGNSAIGRSQPAVQRRLANRRAVGDDISNIDLIDATKQELDDQIGVALRQGENNLVRELVRLKNLLVSEADAAIPEYAQARQLFAGKAQLESAAEFGTQFFKLKPREVAAFVQSMGESELRMFRLGAKEAIIDRMDNIQISADAVRRLFGKRGEVAKLRLLFKDDESFQQFSDTLERESNFIMTRRAAQANSTTIQQGTDSRMVEDVFNAARGLAGDPVSAASTFGRIFSGLSQNKNSEAFIRALEAAGDLLLESGMNPARLQAILRAGDAERIKRLIENRLINESMVVAPVIRGATAAAFNSEVVN